MLKGRDEVDCWADSTSTEWKRPRLWPVPVVVTSSYPCPVINGIISGLALQPQAAKQPTRR